MGQTLAPIMKRNGMRGFIAQSPDWCRRPFYVLGETRQKAGKEYWQAVRRIKGYGWDWFEARDD